LWEDQQRINEFSKLNGRLAVYDQTLKEQRAEKEFLDDVSMELELIDEDEKVQYKIGDAFVFLPQSEVMERLAEATGKLNSELDHTEELVSETEKQMDDLKRNLYAKFGNAINLER
jgi:prefoldin subunit 4